MTISGNEHATTDRLAGKAHDTVEQLAKGAGKAEEQIRDAGVKAKAQSNEVLHSMSLFVRENPLAAVGLAFAAGTLLAWLRKRRT